MSAWQEVSAFMKCYAKDALHKAIVMTINGVKQLFFDKTPCTKASFFLFLATQISPKQTPSLFFIILQKSIKNAPDVGAFFYSKANEDFLL